MIRNAKKAMAAPYHDLGRGERAAGGRAGHYPDLGKGLEGADAGHDEYVVGCGRYQGPGDSPEHRPSAGAVNACGFVVRLVDVLQSGQKDDGTIPDALPDTHHHEREKCD
jgi:hypothetical protein